MGVGEGGVGGCCTNRGSHPARLRRVEKPAPTVWDQLFQWRRHPDCLTILARFQLAARSTAQILASLVFRYEPSVLIRLDCVELKICSHFMGPVFQWRRHPDSNRGIKVLQTSALTTWPWRLNSTRKSLTFRLLALQRFPLHCLCRLQKWCTRLRLQEQQAASILLLDRWRFFYR